MLSAFVKKLLFSRQLNIDRNINVLGINKIMVSPSLFFKIDSELSYSIAEKIFKKETVNFSKKIGLSGAKLIDLSLNLLETYGFGKFSLMGKTSKSFAIRVDDTPFYKKSKKATCHFTAGALAGIFSVVFKKKFKCTEKMCLSKGDPYCKFVLVVIK